MGLDDKGCGGYRRAEDLSYMLKDSKTGREEELFRTGYLGS